VTYRSSRFAPPKQQDVILLAPGIRTSCRMVAETRNTVGYQRSWVQLSVMVALWRWATHARQWGTCVWGMTRGNVITGKRVIISTCHNIRSDKKYYPVHALGEHKCTNHSIIYDIGAYRIQIIQILTIFFLFWEWWDGSIVMARRSLPIVFHSDSIKLLIQIFKSRQDTVKILNMVLHDQQRYKLEILHNFQ
jgi:hypothetical protein